MENYKTNNFDIYYKKTIYKIPTTLTIELLRKYYYQKLINEFVSQCSLHNLIISETKNDIKFSEIFSYFIINKSDEDIDDPILSSKPKYSYDYIKNIIKNSLKHDKEKIDYFKTQLKIILIDCENLMKKYYKEFKKNITLYDNIFTIEKVIYNDIIILNIVQLNEFIIPIESFKFSIHNSLYIHLIKLYSVRNYNEYNITNYEPSWIHEFDERVFILYTRYNYLLSGSTQASIKPQFKKLLTEKLNIKIELFASAINSSYTNYCSLFYDIEQYFGGLGSYFNTEIRAGYYEINPPFEENIIIKVFNKVYNELINAQKNKLGLLFCIIIPRMNLSNIPSFLNLKDFEYFIKLYDKKDFYYLHYEKDFKYTLTRNIIDTYVIIYYTSYIKNPVKNNIKLKNFIYINK